MTTSRCNAVIFDLDGTLIDSAPSILESFRLVLLEAGLTPQVALDAALIGPPLRQTLMKITGIPAGDELESLAKTFQRIYDNDGYRATDAYPGVADLLSLLAGNGLPVAIATNKRRTPTLKILSYFGWGDYFRQVGTIDTPNPSHADKATLIRSLLAELKLDARQTLYVGDKYEDGEAAAANGMPFIAVGWGYGEWDEATMPSGWGLARTLQDLSAQLGKLRPQELL
jgi:phosphoglycolate phosphatase